MAPELLRKSTTTSDPLEMQCADVYSFGIIMYEVLSRKEPFEDDKEFLTLEGDFYTSFFFNITMI